MLVNPVDSLCLAAGNAVQRQGQGSSQAPAGLFQLQPGPVLAPSGVQPSVPSAIARMADAPNPFAALVVGTSAEPPPFAKPMLSGVSAMAGSSTLAPISPRQQAVGSAPAAVAFGSGTVAPAIPNPFARLATSVHAGPLTSAPVSISGSQQAPVPAGAGCSVPDSSTPTSTQAPSPAPAPSTVKAAVKPAAATEGDITASTSAPFHYTTSTPFSTIFPASIFAATASVPSPQGVSQLSNAQASASAMFASASMQHAAVTMRAMVPAKVHVSPTPAAPVPLQSFQVTGASALSAPSGPKAASLSLLPVAAATAAMSAPVPAAAAANMPPASVAAAKPATASVSAAVPAAAASLRPLSAAAAVPAAVANLPPTSVAAAVPAATATLPSQSVAAFAPAVTANLAPLLVAAAVPGAPASLPTPTVTAAVPAAVLAAMPAATGCNRPASKRKWDVMAQPQPDAGTTPAAALQAVASGLAAGSLPVPPLSLVSTAAPPAQSGREPLQSGPFASSSGAAGLVSLPIPGKDPSSLTGMVYARPQVMIAASQQV